MKKEGIIFDLDGTMVDNMMVHHYAWQKTLMDLDCYLALDEIIENMHGVNEEALERLFGDTYDFKQRVEISRKKESLYRSLFRPKLKLIKGLSSFFKECSDRKITMSIATAAPKANLDFVIDNLGIRYLFQSTLHSGSVSKGKPDPEILLKSAEVMGVEPDRCLVFEDSPTGVKTANNAEIEVIAITTTHPIKDFKGLRVSRFLKDYTEINAKEILDL
ncbi:MAG: HAD family phosphatase [Bacteroidota bacterium]